AGAPDDRGHRDAQSALHSLGRDLHLDRGLVEPACGCWVVETDGGRDGRVPGGVVLPGVVLPGRDLGDSPEPVHLSRHRRVAWQRDLGRVARLHLTLLPGIEVHLHLERVGCGLRDLCTWLGGSTELAAHAGDPHPLRQAPPPTTLPGPRPHPRPPPPRGRPAPARAGPPPDRAPAPRSDPRPAWTAASRARTPSRSRTGRRTGRAALGSRTRGAPGWRWARRRRVRGRP